jgi:leucyl aminopeptidase
MILVVGVGEDRSSRTGAFESAATAIRTLADRPREKVLFALAESFDSSAHDSIVAGALFGCEGQSIYQSEPKLQPPRQISFSGISPADIDRGTVIGQSINHVRRLVNEPPAMIYPESFAQRASELATSVGLSVEVWDEQKLAAEGCRALLAVGAASAKPPRLVILRHDGGGSEPPIALVGKGVTFDSGGLSLKSSEGMAIMKCDMAGAATVVGVMHALARLGVKKNVIGLCGLAENMVSGDSYKLGDVIETRSGKTIEILNTDAEGRVVLADTLDVAIQFQPTAMVDLATLTGACMVALGNEVAGLMTNDQATCDSVSQAAEVEGEPVWQLPMFDLYDEKVKSKVADIKNVGEARWGGAITAAKFLQNFVGDVPWVHVDIAGPAFADSPTSARDAGATGVMVRSLLRWIESR